MRRDIIRSKAVSRALYAFWLNIVPINFGPNNIFTVLAL